PDQHVSPAHQPRVAPPPRLQQLTLLAAKRQHVPRDQPEDREGEAEMGSEPVARHPHHLALEARRDHPPADRPLQPAEDAEEQKSPRPPRRHLPRDQEPGETDRPDETDHPPELAMPPFPPVDDLEFGEAHALIDALVLRYLAIEGEFPLPVLERERRQ